MLRIRLGLTHPLAQHVFVGIQVAGGLRSRNAPILFATNTRYALPVFAIAMVLLATASSLRRLAPLMTLGLTALTLSLIAMSDLKQSVRYAWGVPLALAIGLFVLGVRAIRRRRIPVASALVAAISIVITVAGVAAVQTHYLKNRYAASVPATAAMVPITAPMTRPWSPLPNWASMTLLNAPTATPWKAA